MRPKQIRTSGYFPEENASERLNEQSPSVEPLSVHFRNGGHKTPSSLTSPVQHKLCHSNGDS